MCTASTESDTLVIPNGCHTLLSLLYALPYAIIISSVLFFTLLIAGFLVAIL